MAAEIVGDQVPAMALSLKTGGACLLIGTLAFAMARLLHGDTPAADADAALTFVARRPTYAAVHIVAVLAAATTAIGIMALASSLTRPSAWLLGRAGTTTAVIGTAIFGVESTSEGLALPELASAAWFYVVELPPKLRDFVHRVVRGRGGDRTRHRTTPERDTETTSARGNDLNWARLGPEIKTQE